ncbi:MAG: type B 50S ribosomal protein L31 [Candidatus Pacebacteria bacterium]|nr:type B 50S ribosomal protein L31 [Candidatus Paceibacterota bacterium]
MKKGIHPETNRYVVFEDNQNGSRFLVMSTLPSKETVKWEDGVEYPLIRSEITSASHPFYTGKDTVLDTAGRVDRFKKRAAAKK